MVDSAPWTLVALKVTTEGSQVSHVADVDIRIKDLTCFKAAVEALGGEYLATETKIRWYGRFLNDWDSQQAAVNRIDAKRFGTTDAGVARFKGCAYDLGLLKNPDGSYTPYFDSYGGGGHALMAKLGGMACAKLKDEYAAAVAMRTLARKGFRVTRSVDKAGAITLKAVN
jgi:hypothetical protein